jgi:mono/diheme cytochrome c family protein
MPAFGDSISDADIVAVLSWIKSQWPPETRSQHDELNRQASQRSQH